MDECGKRELQSKAGIAAETEGIDYRAILDHVPFCVTVADSNGVFQYANARYWKETGIAPESVLGKNLEDIAREGLFFKESFGLRALKEQRIITEVSLNNGYGKHKYGYVTSIPIIDEDNHLTKVVTSIINPYDLRMGYEQFKEAMKKEDSIKIVEHFDQERNEIFIGENESIKGIRQLAERVAPTDATVLITGESGSGKEAVADYIYNCCSRKGKPFIKINCAAIPENLLEAELFGYEKGAFTGANDKGRTGLLEAANHGTILLDEIGDFPLHLQPKLLRVLQQGTLFRIGSNTPHKVDIRFIAATNCDLAAKVQDGSFRKDLYYRLRVIPISVPPLRERQEDIPRLARKFLGQYCRHHNRNIFIPDEIMPLFQQYDWPGNVRELQNIIEYLIICTDEGEEVSVRGVQTLLGMSGREVSSVRSEGTLFERRNRFEKRVIEQTLMETGNVRETARQLGIYISSLYRKIEKYNIDTAKLVARSKEK